MSDNETNGTALVPHTGLDVMKVGEVLAASGFFPDIKRVSQAVAKILAGQEVGLGPVASLRGVYIINGVPSYSANTIAAAIKRHPRYDYKVRRLDADACDLEFFEDGASVGRSTFDMKDAKAASLAGGNWSKYPRNMLFSRALTNGSRWYCPDAFGGLTVYTPDELGANVNAETGEIIEGQAHEIPNRSEGEAAGSEQPDSQDDSPAAVLEPQERAQEPRSGAKHPPQVETDSDERWRRWQALRAEAQGLGLAVPDLTLPIERDHLDVAGKSLRATVDHMKAQQDAAQTDSDFAADTDADPATVASAAALAAYADSFRHAMALGLPETEWELAGQVTARVLADAQARIEEAIAVAEEARLAEAPA